MSEEEAPREIASDDAARVHAEAAAWRKRSERIRRLRKGLPIAIAAVGVVVVGWVVARSVMLGLNDIVARASEVRMTNPRFFGQDAKGRSFVVGAAEAVREVNGREIVRLEKPMLRLDNASNRPTELSAGRGVYDEEGRRASLTGGVKISDARTGFRFDAGEAIVDTRTGEITGKKSVKGSGPIGEISASSYGIYDEGRRLVFEGGVRGRIVQDTK